jgi:hypothetical protein
MIMEILEKELFLIKDLLNDLFSQMNEAETILIDENSYTKFEIYTLHQKLCEQ